MVYGQWITSEVIGGCYILQLPRWYHAPMNNSLAGSLMYTNEIHECDGMMQELRLSLFPCITAPSCIDEGSFPLPGREQHTQSVQPTTIVLTWRLARQGG